MHQGYAGVITRFLGNNERLMLSDENEMPLVIEADQSTDVKFLQDFLSQHSTQLINDMARYGAVLLRGFDISSDEEFEKTILSIKGFQGISEAFMSEQGRIHVGNLQYVLHTNAVYKTGGTLYLGGFHSENYYSADVPAYISFCCLEPSALGGETGLVNMEKVTQSLSDELKQKLEKNTFFVGKWLVTEVAERYQISPDAVMEICKHFDLPIVGNGKDKFVLMYKPAMFIHPITNKKSFQINLFEILPLNKEMRKCFMNDYPGSAWFWHRVVWKMPAFILKSLEYVYLTIASLFYSPKESFKILLSKFNFYRATMISHSTYNDVKVGSCLNDKDVKDLARLIRKYYSSCLWKKGDILLVDNMKVMHAGMPGAGSRLIRAMICNPMDMKYSYMQPGSLYCKNSNTQSIGYWMSKGKTPCIEMEAEFS